MRRNALCLLTPYKGLRATLANIMTTKNLTRKAFKRANAFDMSFSLIAFCLVSTFFIQSLLQALGD